MLKHHRTLSGHQNPIYALALSQEGEGFFSAGNDKGIVKWSLKKMAFERVLMPVPSSVYALHCSSQFLFSGERSGAFNVYDLHLEKSTQRISAHIKPVFAIQSLSKKGELVTASEDGSVAIWSIPEFERLYQLPLSQETVRCIAVSPQEDEVSFGCKNHYIYVYDTHDFHLKTAFKAHEMPVTSLCYDPSGRFLLSGGRDAQLKLWDRFTSAPLQQIPAHLFAVYAIAFHPFLPYFATASQDKSIKLWHQESFRLIKILSLEKTGIGHTHSVNSLIWSRDGQYLISAGDDRQVMVWTFELPAP